MTLLKANSGLAPFVSLDFHHINQFFPLSLKVDIDNELSEKSVLKALKEKLFSANLFGFQALRFTHGLNGAMIQGMESCRRILSRTLRQLIKIDM